MADLAVFSSPDAGENKGEITTPITPTKKGGKRKLGGSLATTVKGEMTTLPSSDSLQVIELIERQYGADLVHDIYAALQKESENQGAVFNNALAVEEIITLSRIRNIENAKKFARERMDVATKLEQLLKLKAEADTWMAEDNFVKMVDFWYLQRCKPNEIVARMLKDARTLHMELIDFQITSDGYDVPKYKFLHEDKIEACRNRLLELGADLVKLKEMGIEV
jgi:hypothetical protein